MSEKIKKAIAENPLQFYDTVLFLSSQYRQPFEQDFAMMGDAETIARHFAIMLNRHQQFREMVFFAITIYEAAKSEMSKKS